MLTTYLSDLQPTTNSIQQTSSHKLVLIQIQKLKDQITNSIPWSTTKHIKNSGSNQYRKHWKQGRNWISKVKRIQTIDWIESKILEMWHSWKGVTSSKPRRFWRRKLYKPYLRKKSMARRNGSVLWGRSQKMKIVNMMAFSTTADQEELSIANHNQSNYHQACTTDQIIQLPDQKCKSKIVKKFKKMRS